MWVTETVSPQENEAFASIDACVERAGELVSNYGLNLLKKVEVCGLSYYVKQYHRRGKGLRRYFGRSRARGEWENLILFQSLGIPSPRLVAYGESTEVGVVVTEEISGAVDMETYTEDGIDAQFVENVIDRLSGYVHDMHQHSFAHNDLNWRNILVTNSQESNEETHDCEPEDKVSEIGVYVADSPLGRRYWRPFLPRRVVKDLACLDKVAKHRLRRSQRLRFYLKYKNLERLNNLAKREIRGVLRFFEGRE